MEIGASTTVIYDEKVIVTYDSKDETLTTKIFLGSATCLIAMHTYESFT